MDKLTEEDIIYILNTYDYNEYFSAYTILGANGKYETLHAYNLFDHFLEAYKNNSTSDVKFDETLISLLQQKTTETNPREKVKIFAKIFSSEATPIYYYDENFWNLITFKETSELRNFWKDPNYSSSHVNAYNSRKAMLIKEMAKEGVFDALTYHLVNSYKKFENKADTLINYWLDLAKKKENKVKLENQEIPNFLESFANYLPKKGHAVKKIEVLGLFKTQKALEMVKEKHEESFNDPIVLEATTKVLETFGISVKKELLIFEEKTEEEIHYLYKKIINPQALIQQKIVNKTEMNFFLVLLVYFFQDTLGRKGAEIKGDWVKREDENNRTKYVYEIEAKIKHTYYKEEINQWMSDVLKLSVNAYLKNNREDLKNYDIHNMASKEKFVHFYEGFIKAAILKDKIEKDMTITEDKPIPKKIKI